MVEDVLKIEFESLKLDLIEHYKLKGMEASGKWAKELDNVSSGLTGKIIGMNYSEQLEYGRRAGKFPPIESIKRWIEDKGIAARIRGDISVSSLAFLIARKIAREGWKREKHGGVDLISEVVTPQRMQSIINKCGEEALINEVGILLKDLKTVEV